MVEEYLTLQQDKTMVLVLAADYRDRDTVTEQEFHILTYQIASDVAQLACIGSRYYHSLCT